MKKYCGRDDVNMREYYGSSIQDRLRTWAFKRRITAVRKLLLKHKVKIDSVLDVGSGALFMGYLLIKNFDSRYVGVDILPLQQLKKYRRIMEIATGKKIETLRASATFLPFKDRVFDTIFSLDVLEHLEKPQSALQEINRVSSGKAILSLPLENILQKLIRLPILLSEGILKDPTSSYHYIGEFKSYIEMWTNLLRKQCIDIEYSPVGIFPVFNFYAIHLCETKQE
ncbi:MAG: class I SAM-dependent methyltransferase [Dehalococcoidia bacterium]|nr:MAG: class I SAM-dependent methyltransferase [Dehalococcoidia bacterium]